VKGLRLLEHANRVAEIHGATLIGRQSGALEDVGRGGDRADFTDAVMKDAKLVRANLKQANMTGATSPAPICPGADLSGADLRDAVLVGATIYGCNTTDMRMDGALTDKPSGAPMSRVCPMRT